MGTSRLKGDKIMKDKLEVGMYCYNKTNRKMGNKFI